MEVIDPSPFKKRLTENKYAGSSYICDKLWVLQRDHTLKKRNGLKWDVIASNACLLEPVTPDTVFYMLDDGSLYLNQEGHPLMIPEGIRLVFNYDENDLYLLTMDNWLYHVTEYDIRLHCYKRIEWDASLGVDTSIDNTQLDMFNGKLVSR
jgi:hypothetical protein